MCKQCETKPVYEFTNKRKLCKKCFIRYFQKKVLYTIRKFKMAQTGNVIGYCTQGCALNQVDLKENIENNIFTKGKNNKGFREVVLEDVLKMFVEKAHAVLAPQAYTPGGYKNLSRGTKEAQEPAKAGPEKSSAKILTKDIKMPTGKKVDKIAKSSTIDQESNKFVHEVINGNLKKLNKIKPVDGKSIKPLYLFLDKEVLLYAKLKNLKFKKEKKEKDKISSFIDKLEKKHPEIKRAIVNSYLKLYNKN